MIDLPMLRISRALYKNVAPTAGFFLHWTLASLQRRVRCAQPVSNVSGPDKVPQMSGRTSTVHLGGQGQAFFLLLMGTISTSTVTVRVLVFVQPKVDTG